MESAIVCALLFSMMWFFYTLGKSKGRAQGKRWFTDTINALTESRNIATKRLREVQEENNELRRQVKKSVEENGEKIVTLMDRMATPPEPRDLHGRTKTDKVQMLNREIRKSERDRKPVEVSHPTPPVRRTVINPAGNMIHHDTSHVGPLDPCGIIGSAILTNLIDDAVDRVTQDSYVAPMEVSCPDPSPSYESPCTSNSSDYSSGSTDFGCSDTSSSSSGW